jgi:hypothetical protein
MYANRQMGYKEKVRVDNIQKAKEERKKEVVPFMWAFIFF